MCFKKTVPLEYKTFYAVRPKQSKILEVLKRNIEDAKILKIEGENITFEFTGKKYMTVIKRYEHVYYIAIKKI